MPAPVSTERERSSAAHLVGTLAMTLGVQALTAMALAGWNSASRS